MIPSPPRSILFPYTTLFRSLAYDLQKQDGRTWKFTLGSGNISAGFERSFHYRVRGGGTWSKEYQITLLRSEEHTSELQSLTNLVCRLLLEKKNKQTTSAQHP